ncbi:MAG TPA: universal stress protein [Diaminobutyricibacter sp.]
MTEHIIVAIDGDASHRAPIRWATDRAKLTGATVELLFVIGRSWGDRGLAPAPELIEAADRILAGARRYAQQQASGVHVTAGWAFGKVSVSVREAGRRSDVIVLGIERRNAAETGFVGSLAVRVAAIAPCTVVAVPHGWAGTGAGGGVVAGIDGTPSSEVALDFAAREALLHGDTLTLVAGGYSANPLLTGLVPERTVDHHRERVLEAAAAAVQGMQPAPTVLTREIEAAPAAALIRASRGSRLLVVGNRQRNTAERTLMGSVAHDVLLNLETPVAIARRHETEVIGHE